MAGELQERIDGTPLANVLFHTTSLIALGQVEVPIPYAGK